MIQPSLSPEDYAFLQRLAAIDFGPIAFKLMHPESGAGWTLEQVTQAINQYRRFLFLHHRHPNLPLVPSRVVDQVWHTHILDTAKYREDCNLLFGRFIDHYPYFGVADAAACQQLEQAFAQTQTLLTAYFGSAELLFEVHPGKLSQFFSQ